MSGKKKRELRDDLKRVLTNLDTRWLKAASHELCEQLSKLLNQDCGRNIQHVLAWTSFFPGEIDLTEFLNEEIDRRTVYLPRVGEDSSMSFVSIDKDWVTSVEAGAFGIPEPAVEAGRAYSTALAPETAIIVPGVAFDEQGARLGRGKGHYDRFLGRAQISSALKIGVCWTLQLVPQVPVDSFDVAMDWICHERGYKRTGVRFEDDFEG